MPNETRRYKSSMTLNDAALKRRNAPGVVSVTMGECWRYADVVVDDTLGDNLDEWMVSQGWVFVKSNPPLSEPLPNLVFSMGGTSYSLNVGVADAMSGTIWTGG